MTPTPTSPDRSDVQTFRAFELSRWEQSCKEYDRSFGPLTTQAGERIIDSISLTADAQNVLDIACGPGHVAAAAARKGWDVLGLDFSPEMINMARTHYPNIEFRIGDAENLEIPDESFSCAIMNFGILHLAQPQRALSEVFRVLRNGGVFRFTVWAPPAEALGFQIVLNAISRHGAKDIQLPDGPAFFKYSDVEASCSELMTTGFRSVSPKKFELQWELPSGEDLFRAFLEGTARTGVLLQAQPTENLEAIRREVVGEIESRFRDGVKITVPMPVMAYIATKL